MVSFQQFCEARIEQKLFNRESVYRGLGIELTERQWETLSDFPALFSHKTWIRQVHLDPRYKDSNNLFLEKVFALVAACMGYGTKQGHKMPKTKLFVYRMKAHETAPAAGTHYHVPSHSWSHEIDIYLDEIHSIEHLFEIIAHELAHSLQHSMRRIGWNYDWENDKTEVTWDKEPYDLVSHHDDEEAYNAQPWEVQAREKAKDAVEYAMGYLQSGVVKGFNPKQV